MWKLIKNIAKKYDDFVESLIPFNKSDLYKDDYSRAKPLMILIPIISMILFFNLGINLLVNNSFPILDALIILYVLVILICSPKILQITRHTPTTGILIGVSISLAITALAYAHPRIFNGTLYYQFAILLLTTYVSGPIGGAVVCFISVASGIIIFNMKVENHPEVLLFLGENAFNFLLIDIPSLTVLTLVIVSQFDKYRQRQLWEIKDSNERLTYLQEEQSLTSKEAALEEMAGGIAHEINNPLFMITGTVEQAQKDPGFDQLSPITQKRLKKVNANAKRIQELVDQLLNFSSAELATDNDSSIAECIRQSLNLLAFELKDNVSIEKQGIDAHVKMNSYSLVKVLVQVLRNAFLAAKEHDFAWVKIKYIDDGVMAYIDIIDAGHGIDSDVVKKIFHPFFTTRDVGKGAGLGLSEARGLLVKAHGDIVYRLYEGNTSFRIIIPVDKSDERKKIS